MRNEYSGESVVLCGLQNDVAENNLQMYAKCKEMKTSLFFTFDHYPFQIFLGKSCLHHLFLRAIGEMGEAAGSLWRNRLARSAVNRKVGGSSPPRDALFFFPEKTAV